MNRRFLILRRLFLLGLILFTLGLVLRMDSGPEEPAGTAPSYPVFLQQVKDGKIKEVDFQTATGGARVTPVTGPGYTIGVPPGASEPLVETLQKEKVTFSSTPVEGRPLWRDLLETMLPLIIIVGLILFLMRGTMGRAFSLRKSPATRQEDSHTGITFDDVAGADEVVTELKEIRDFLAHPERFQKLGARIPRGVLLSGAPGSGKTLLAKAVAGEANAAFFSLSGSDFVEMFVGVGASRVRDLFAQAKKASPAIIFIDEIDAVGRSRTNQPQGGSDEREQTLNQLLVEMDGFDTDQAVIVIGATNRPDILDAALMRPGRFDRRINVPLPDRTGRRAILEVHAKGKPIAAGVDMDEVAQQTAGMAGADLQSLINEAAILAAREGREEITQGDLDEGLLRAVAGVEQRRHVLSDEEKYAVAAHEVGHALISHLMPLGDEVGRVSIISRGNALGYTLALPEGEGVLISREKLKAKMAMLLAGRGAEQVLGLDLSTGAADDLRRASDIAEQMVTRFGMSDVIGPRALHQSDGALQMEPGGTSDLAQRASDEIERLLREAEGEAMAILDQRRELLEHITAELLARETLSRDEFAALAGS